MKHRQQTVAEKGWDGEFGTYDEWARLGPQPPYRSATSLMIKVGVALRSKISLGLEMTYHSPPVIVAIGLLGDEADRNQLDVLFSQTPH
jgi:hypothetical protein